MLHLAYLAYLASLIFSLRVEEVRSVLSHSGGKRTPQLTLIAPKTGFSGTLSNIHDGFVAEVT
jgi:hypothetical protein